MTQTHAKYTKSTVTKYVKIYYPIASLGSIRLDIVSIIKKDKNEIKMNFTYKMSTFLDGAYAIKKNLKKCIVHTICIHICYATSIRIFWSQFSQKADRKTITVCSAGGVAVFFPVNGGSDLTLALTLIITLTLTLTLTPDRSHRLGSEPPFTEKKDRGGVQEQRRKTSIFVVSKFTDNWSNCFHIKFSFLTTIFTLTCIDLYYSHVVNSRRPGTTSVSLRDREKICP